ncbi:hypothetical protein Tco_0073338 [Tanacetum coccineum]
MEVEMASPELESVEWRRLLLHPMCVLPLLHQRMAVKKTFFPEMENSGLIMCEEERRIETLVKLDGDIRHHSGGAVKVANAISRKE